MSVRYLAKDPKECSYLEAAYSKLTRCYDISASFHDILVLPASFMSSNVRIMPLRNGSELHVLKKLDLEKTVDDLLSEELASNPDYCLACSPKHIESRNETYMDVSIVGNSYIINFDFREIY